MRDPIIVISAPRSGSTLLRYILDTHPQVWCPAETGLGALCRQLLATLDAVESRQQSLASLHHEASAPWRGLRDRVRAAPAWSRWPARHARQVSLERARAICHELAARGLQQHGATVWCERTPENVEELDVLQAVFPDARYICLYRQGMDVIHSFLEGTNYGVGSDFAAIVRDPRNPVADVADYWMDSVELGLALERHVGDRAFSIRYEDMVRSPDQTLPALFAFLGVDWLPDLPQRVYASRHSAGVGDRKAELSRSIDPGRIGKGKDVPVRKLKGRLERMNRLLEALGYSALSG
jgi:protein-tyrosine sulfotransferase